MSKPKFLFGDIVVIEEDRIGVIVKTWDRNMSGEFYYEIYNRIKGRILEYEENEIERYSVRHKYLDELELEYQRCY